MKLRLGGLDARDDLQAVKAVKKEIGRGVRLMVDFNQALRRGGGAEARPLADAEGGLELDREPIRADDFAGCARLGARACPPPIGENFMGEQMAQALAAQACDTSCRMRSAIGGVTGWMRAAALAQGAGMEMSSHLFPEVSWPPFYRHANLPLAEYVDWAARSESPLADQDGHAISPTIRAWASPGTRKR